MSPTPYIKLSQLTKQIEDHIKQSFGTQLHWIIAEISGHKPYKNPDRHYFDFVEKIEGQNAETAKVKGIAWQGGSLNIKNFEEVTAQKFTNGIQVLAQVRVEFHAIHGFSLILTDVDPSFTLGNLERQRRETLLKLVELNTGSITKVGEEFITRNKQLRLNPVLQTIALIASPNSEGYNDFIHTMKVNQFGYRFQIDEYQSSVQGAQAENELVNTLIKIYNTRIKYDCVVIVRGGGAKTDFLVFDTYRVAQAVAKFPIPVITGIGHHKDISIVDLMANTATKTPTKAAELIIEQARSFEELVLQAQKNIVIKSQQLLNKARQQISADNLRIVTKSRQLLTIQKEQLSQINQSVITQTKSAVYSAKTILAEIQQVLINSSVSRLHSSEINLSDLNQSISHKTNKILFNSAATLIALSQSIKTNSLAVFYVNQNKLTGLNQNIKSAARSSLTAHQNRFVTLTARLTTKPMVITATKAAELKNASASIQAFSAKYVSAKKSNLEHHKILMQAMSPDNILKKGFAMISQNGKVIKDSKQVEIGSSLTITMNDTELNTKVISKTQNNGRK